MSKQTKQQPNHKKKSWGVQEESEAWERIWARVLGRKDRESKS